MSRPQNLESLRSLAEQIVWAAGEYGIGDTLAGATAFVGFDADKEHFANYFLCTGAADDVPVNAALAYLNTATIGNLRFAAGTYDIENDLTLPDIPLDISGAGKRSTILVAGANNVGIFKNTTTQISYITIRHLGLYGYRSTYTGTNGVEGVFERGLFFDLDFNEFEDYAMDFIGLSAAQADRSYENKILACNFLCSGAAGNPNGFIHFAQYASDNIMEMNTLTGGTQVNYLVHAESGYQMIQNNNHFVAPYLAHIYLTTSGNQIKGNYFDNSERDGIYVRPTTGTIEGNCIHDNLFFENCRETNATYSSIVLDAAAASIGRTSIRDNEFIAPAAGNLPAYHIEQLENVGAVDYTKIESNQFDTGSYATAVLLLTSATDTIKTNHNINPYGVIATPFDNVGNTFGLPAGGAAGPTNANTDYRCIGVDTVLDSTGGTAVSITLEDPSSNVISTVGATAVALCVPIGYIVNFGNFSAAPTVIVAGN